MEAFLRALLPRLLPGGCTFEVHPFQGKDDLMDKLEARLRAYAKWLPDDWRIIVLVDRDDDDCQTLKQRLDAMASAAGLSTRSSSGGQLWQVVNRIAIEELEAWYFGDWQAVCRAYPKVSLTVPNREGYRNPDTIRGTWEAFERILKQQGYFRTGLRKVEAARAIGAHFDPACTRSRSFVQFRDAIAEATA
jgi:hypothetical protein